MILQELNEIKTYTNEKSLITTLEYIRDRILFNGYNENEVIKIVLVLINIDILSLSYEGREELLNLLCDAISNYNIKDKVNWSKIIAITELIESTLKEYITEYFL